ncbi:MAG: tetratricopeptide repeat protein [Lachnospiraceae bacterium]|nr:tetratricopeptide repeat protein [Lachnospiraceae bacterium]
MGHNNSNLAEKKAKIAVIENEPSAGKKASGRKRSGVKKTAHGKKAAAGGETSQGKKEVYDMRKASAEKKAANVTESTDDDRDSFEARMSRRDEERARRRAEREKKVRRQKIIMAVSAGIILLSAIGVAVFCLPAVKVFFRLSQGDRYMAKEDYGKARSAYEKALEADPASTKAYRSLAELFDRQQMAAEEEQILYTGWEKTQDEELLQYYSVAVLNQAVADLNAKNCTLATVDKCIRVLEQGTEKAKALELLSTCYERLFKVTEEADTCSMFFDENIEHDSCSYAEYEQLLRRMLTVYQADSSEETAKLLKRYAVIDMPYVRISLPHMESYSAVLTEINNVLNDTDLTETLACLARAKEVSEYFHEAFEEFAAGNYAYARDLVSEDTYQKIRDEFIEENSGYWEGSVYIPVSREQMALHREAGKVRFSFLGNDDYANRQGIITVWGTHQEDDGVQRSVISYEPPEDDGAASHTEYTVQYLYSNVKIDGQYVPQMNYRFDTKVTTSEGITTNAVGDWGGEHEWEIDY